jgi:hypothetical protein
MLRKCPKTTENTAAVDESIDEAREEFIEPLTTAKDEAFENEAFALSEAKETLTGEVIPPYATYAEYKQELDREVRQEVEGYVRIGYLLKIARDTSILAESGYANLYEFAQAEYSIDKSRVSRYMAINDRFAENGYSMELKDEYKGYAVQAKIYHERKPCVSGGRGLCPPERRRDA